METTNQVVYQWSDIKDCEELQIENVDNIIVDLTGLKLPSKNLFNFLRANAEFITSLCIGKCKINVLALHMIFSIVGSKLQELRMYEMTIYGPKNGRGMEKIEMPNLTTMELLLNEAQDFDFIGAVIIPKNLKNLELPFVEYIKYYAFLDDDEPNGIRPSIKSILSHQKSTMKKLTLTKVLIDDSLIDRLMLWGFQHLVLKACVFECNELSKNVNKSIKQVKLIDMNTANSDIEFGICKILQSCHGARKLSLVNVQRSAGII